MTCFRRRTTRPFGAPIPFGRLAVLAAGPRGAAEAWCERHSVRPVVLLSGPELLAGKWRLPKQLRTARLDTVIAHSQAWPRQEFARLFQAAILLVPATRRLIVDDTGVAAEATRGDLVRELIEGLPYDLAEITTTLVAESTRNFLRDRRTGSRHLGSSNWVLAIWQGGDTSVGGSVSHISGMLGGLRHAGYKIALATSAPPPDQLAAVVDDICVSRPVGSGSRTTWDLKQLSANRPLRNAAMRLSNQHRPRFVYQRHDYGVGLGTDVADDLGVPLVLEWSGSQVWARSQWKHQGPLPALRRILLDPICRRSERTIVTKADLVSAVSYQAARVAIDVGAATDRVVIIPNGANPAEIDLALRTNIQTDGLTRLGWVGSFGPWHGADVLVRAMPLLPDGIYAVMVGDGEDRPACEELARSLGVADRISFAGSLPHDEALARLAACDLLVSPHVPDGGVPFFGSPTKLFEYMLLGRPIVASRLEQIGEILVDKVTAVLVEPGSSEALAEGVWALLTAPDAGHGLGAAARRSALAEHTWDRRATDLLSALADPRLSRRPPPDRKTPASNLQFRLRSFV